MAYEKIGSGTFGSRAGVETLIELWARDDAGVGELGELRFPYDEPLLVEWQDTAKEEVIQGSTATLRLLSPGDRSYVGLYTEKVGGVALRVYRGGELWWNGVLDPEFYEEPYSEVRDYEVSLTFSDFGLWDRLTYTLTGLRTPEAVLLDALGRVGLVQTSVDVSLLSTTRTDGTSVGLSGLSVRSDNWLDEDGEASTLKDVIEGMLQPLGVKLVQRGGKIWAYDLNGWHSGCASVQVEWQGDDQELGTDKVYNGVEVDFSPYADTELMSLEMDWQGAETVDDVTPYLSQLYVGGAAYMPDYSADTLTYKDGDGNTVTDWGNVSFVALLDTSAKNSTLAEMDGYGYFKTMPLNGGEDCEGVVWGFYTGGHGSLKSGLPKLIGQAPRLDSRSTLMRTRRVWLPTLSESVAKGYRLVVTQKMLLDARYNPFEQASDGNEKGNYDGLGYMLWVAVPMKVTVWSAESGGTALWHYENASLLDYTANKGTPTIKLCQGSWSGGAATWEDAWLEWYDETSTNEDFKRAIDGWTANRQAIWGRDGGLGQSPSLKAADGGQMMPYPPEGGWLEVDISGGLLTCYKPTGFWREGGVMQGFEGKGDNMSLDGLRWRLYKLPTVELKRWTTVLDDLDDEDIVSKGVLDEDAEDTLELSTTCGTARTPVPTSRGNYVDASTGGLVSLLKRNGRTETAEQLLIGTLHSQYASRKTKLTGTARLVVGDGYTGDLAKVTVSTEEGKAFLVTAETATPDADETELTLVETRADEYDSLDGEMTTWH